MSIVVPLTAEEQITAASIGIRRQIAAVAKGRDPGTRPENEGWSAHVVGALGELAYAKWRKVYWPATVGRPDYDGDVGDAEVRSTERVNGRLLLKTADPEDRAYILVVVQNCQCIIHGWLWGHEAKKPDYWDATMPSPCFAVPQRDLHPFA